MINSVKATCRLYFALVPQDHFDVFVLDWRLILYRIILYVQLSVNTSYNLRIARSD